jgi:hypothetical protein
MPASIKSECELENALQTSDSSIATVGGFNYWVIPIVNCRRKGRWPYSASGSAPLSYLTVTVADPQSVVPVALVAKIL